MLSLTIGPLALPLQPLLLAAGLAVALLLSFLEKGLLTVALSACGAAFAVDLILSCLAA